MSITGNSGLSLFIPEESAVSILLRDLYVPNGIGRETSRDMHAQTYGQQSYVKSSCELVAIMDHRLTVFLGTPYCRCQWLARNKDYHHQQADPSMHRCRLCSQQC